MKKKANVKDISALVKHWLVLISSCSWWCLLSCSAGRLRFERLRCTLGRWVGMS